MPAAGPLASLARVPSPRVSNDDGSVDLGLASALTAYGDEPARLPEVLAALHSARVLAPVVAVLQEAGTPPAGLPVDKASDIALPLLLDADGGKALIVFSSLDALHLWDRSARPVPVTGPRAAEVALAEGAEGLVLDVAGPSPVTLGLPEVRALADGRGAVPAYDDDGLASAVALVLAGEPRVVGGWITPGPGVDAVLTVVLDPVAGEDPAGAGLAEQLRGLALRPGAVRGLDLAVQTGLAPEPAGRKVYSRVLS